MTSTTDMTDRVDAESIEPTDKAAEQNFVPAWLAVLVLVLLLAVMAVGGFVIRGIVAGDSAKSVYDLEISKWSKEVKVHPGDLLARLNLGYAYQKAGRLDNAIEQYEYVIEREPKNPAALYNMALVYRQLNLDDKAEEVLWDLLEATPDHAMAARELGEIYAERKQYRSLIRAVRPVVQANPSVADLQYLMGLAYENTGKPTWAVARYRLALRYAPDYEDAKEGLRRLGETP